MSQAETENLPVLQLDVISDVICPWCFIGKRKLDAALENLKDVRVNLMWRPYQLYPDTPMEGRSDSQNEATLWRRRCQANAREY